MHFFIFVPVLMSILENILFYFAKILLKIGFVGCLWFLFKDNKAKQMITGISGFGFLVQKWLFRHG